MNKMINHIMQKLKRASPQWDDLVFYFNLLANIPIVLCSGTILLYKE